MGCCEGDKKQKLGNSKKPGKKFWFISVLIIAGLIFLIIPKSSLDGSVVSAQEITIYKSLSCGCCDVYSKYLNSKKFDVDEINVGGDISEIKKEYKVPSALESCHTSVINGYFVEGHIPVEAINKLLTEKPDIDGIAMPGMPSGAPGMTGSKYDDFVIYSVKDGNYQEFMRI